MNWDVAEEAIRDYVEAQWALGSYADVKIFWENEDWVEGTETFIYITIEGMGADKSIFGSVGKRISVEHGIVFLHAFIGKGRGKSPATKMVIALTQILEIKTIAEVIDLEGGAPPSPVDDDSLISGQPGGNYYRCSGSVPFIIRGNI